MKNITNKLKWWIIWLLLTKEERSAMSSLLRSACLNHYAECMGETYKEYSKIMQELKNQSIH